MRNVYLVCLRACLQHDLDTVRNCVNDACWNWEEFLRHANEHGVLPSISSALVSDSSFIADAEVASFLLAVHALNGERNTVIREETKVVARLLNEIGIQPILLKGAAYLASGVYPDPAARYLIDIDLMVPKEDVEAAAEVLMANGYAADQDDDFARFRHHHPPLRRTSCVSVEIHHRLGMGPCESLLGAAEVIQQSIALDLDGVSVRVPCPQHLMTHLIMHSQIQHPYQERIWLPLRTAYDLVMIDRRFGRDVNWPSIEHAFRAAGQHGLLVLFFMQVREDLGFELPVPTPLSALVRVRWLRRKLLRNFPVLRYFDPLYMFSTICIRRMRLLANVLRTRGGPEYLASHLLRVPVYGRLLFDIREGRGRS